MGISPTCAPKQEPEMAAFSHQLATVYNADRSPIIAKFICSKACCLSFVFNLKVIRLDIDVISVPFGQSTAIPQNLRVVVQRALLLSLHDHHTLYKVFMDNF